MNIKKKDASLYGHQRELWPLYLAVPSGGVLEPVVPDGEYCQMLASCSRYKLVLAACHALLM